MTFTLEELAAASGGELSGDPKQTITGAASVGEATAGEITFYANPKYVAAFRKSQASAAFVPLDFSEQVLPAQIRVAHPAKAFEQVVIRLAPQPVTYPAGIHSTAVIGAGVELGADISVQPFAVIEPNVKIGARTLIGAHSYVGHDSVVGVDCKIYPRVTIRERAHIGDRVVIHSGAVIGADGFGFELVHGRHQKVPQIGIVQLDDDVEIGANTTIDRARFGRTWIQEGVKIDNLVQIAHNVVIGKHSIIVAQVGISGSTRLGEYVTLAGQVGVVGHVEIGAKTVVGAQGGVTRSLPPGETWWATPVVPLSNAKRQTAWLHRLGTLFARVKVIEQKLGL